MNAKKRTNKGTNFYEDFAIDDMASHGMKFARGRIILEYYADELGTIYTMDAKAARRALNAMFAAYLDSPQAEIPQQKAEVITLYNRLNELLCYVNDEENSQS